MSHPTDPETQRALFGEAVALLGGQRRAARAIGVAERTIHAVVAGERTLHDGFLRDIAAALIAHAEACRQLERRLSPAFAANLTERQADGKPHNWRYDQRPGKDA